MAEKKLEAPVFDIDAEVESALEERREERPEPFMVRASKDSDAFGLLDPELLDWQDAYLAASSDSPFEVLALIIPPENIDEFFAKEINVRTMRKLVDGWRDHYGIDEETYRNGGGQLNRAQRRAKERAKKRNKK